MYNGSKDAFLQHHLLLKTPVDSARTDKKMDCYEASWSCCSTTKVSFSTNRAWIRKLDMSRKLVFRNRLSLGPLSIIRESVLFVVRFKSRACEHSHAKVSTGSGITLCCQTRDRKGGLNETAMLTHLTTLVSIKLLFCPKTLWRPVYI